MSMSISQLPTTHDTSPSSSTGIQHLIPKHRWATRGVSIVHESELSELRVTVHKHRAEYEYESDERQEEKLSPVILAVRVLHKQLETYSKQG